MNVISRRKILGRAGLLAATAIGVNSFAAETEKPGKSKVIVTGGHPGDPEYGCGGTIARLSQAGHDVALLYLNRGDPSEVAGVTKNFPRVSEATKACEILQARSLFAGQIDGAAVVDPAHYDAFRILIEKEKPALVLTHWPLDNHADHRAMFMLVYETWRRMKKSFALYFYEVSTGEDTVQFAPTEFIDISATEKQKRDACFAHASQSPERYYKLQEMVARMRGAESGHTFAEGFVRHAQSARFEWPG